MDWKWTDENVSLLSLSYWKHVWIRGVPWTFFLGSKIWKFIGIFYLNKCFMIRYIRWNFWPEKEDLVRVQTWMTLKDLDLYFLWTQRLILGLDFNLFHEFYMLLTYKLNCTDRNGQYRVLIERIKPHKRKCRKSRLAKCEKS